MLPSLSGSQESDRARDEFGSWADLFGRGRGRGRNTGDMLRAFDGAFQRREGVKVDVRCPKHGECFSCGSLSDSGVDMDGIG